MLLLGLALALTLSPMPASAVPGRQVLLVVLTERSYEQVLADPLLADLAGAGGIGLMTSSGGADRASRTAVSLGAGRSASDAPPGPVPFDERGGGLIVDVEPYGEVAGDAIPGLLGSALSNAGLAVGYVGPRTADGDVAMLTAMDRGGRIPAAVLGASPEVEDPAAAASDPATGIIVGADLVVSPDPGVVQLALERTQAGDVLVVVVGAGASGAMRDRGDIVGPIVLARGSPEELLRGGQDPIGLTSSTTRRPGIVSDVDVAPTVLDFLRVRVPSDMVGSRIRPSAAPPSDLHERYLQHQRVVGPVGLAALAFALVSLAAGLVVVFGLRRPAPRLSGAVGVATLVSAALLVALVPTSVLPTYALAVVVGCLVAVAVVVVAIALRLGRQDPRAAVVAVAASGLAFVLLDGVLGWPGQLTPMLGGGSLDGERFFGLGNAHAGFVLAGAVLLAARLPTPAGVGLIVAASVFAGLPFLGADLGGCLTLAVAAALWFGLCRWRTLGWRTWALAAGAFLGALILVAVADAILPGGPTHLSTVAGGEDGPLGGIALFGDRLVANVRSTSQTPAAWLAVLGLPFWLAVAIRRPRRLRPTLDPDDRWRDAIVVLALGGIVGYLLNDTHGMVGVTFTFVSAAMLYPTLAAAGVTTAVPGVAVEVAPETPS